MINTHQQSTHHVTQPHSTTVMRPERPQGVRGAVSIFGWCCSQPVMYFALPKRSLFEILRRTNQSLIILHSATVMRGRAVARPSCVYTVNNDDNDDGVDVINHDVALLPFVEILDIWSHFGIELRILTSDRVESIGKTLIFGLDSTINR